MPNALRNNTTPPLVSFLVPTLNRGRYVARAVRSCLVAGATAGEQVEVIVVDSESDDGSWEDLKDEHGDDPRVRLIQNRRGSGPTRSWLDAALAARGEFATFVWSDDYVSSDFLTELLPGISDGDSLAVGAAVIRGIDCEDPLPRTNERARVAVGHILAGYLGVPQPEETLLPMSPACALFRRAVLRDWCERVVPASQGSRLRRELMWKSAIGPDLLLFQVALENQIGPVYQSQRAIVQFSAHSGSITTGSMRWRVNIGYWLARSTMMRSEGVRQRIEGANLRAAEVATLVDGLVEVARVCPVRSLTPLDRARVVISLVREMATLARISLSDHGPFLIRDVAMTVVARTKNWRDYRKTLKGNPKVSLSNSGR